MKSNELCENPYIHVVCWEALFKLTRSFELNDSSKLCLNFFLQEETGVQIVQILVLAKMEDVANRTPENACAFQAGKVFTVKISAVKTVLVKIVLKPANARWAKDVTMFLGNVCLVLRELMDSNVPKNVNAQPTERHFVCIPQVKFNPIFSDLMYSS